MTDNLDIPNEFYKVNVTGSRCWQHNIGLV